MSLQLHDNDGEFALDFKWYHTLSYVFVPPNQCFSTFSELLRKIAPRRRNAHRLPIAHEQQYFFTEMPIISVARPINTEKMTNYSH